MPGILGFFGFGQFGDRLDGDKDGKLFETLGDLHPHLRGPGDQAGGWVFFQDRKQLLEGPRAEEHLPVLSIFHRPRSNDRLGEGAVEVVQAFLLSLRQGAEGGFADRSVAGAATEIPAQLVIQLPCAIQILAVVALEHRHDEAWGAVAALGTVVSRHGLLHRMGTSVFQTLHRNHLPPSHEDQRGQTAVD